MASSDRGALPWRSRGPAPARVPPMDVARFRGAMSCSRSVADQYEREPHQVALDDSLYEQSGWGPPSMCNLHCRLGADSYVIK